MRVARVPFLVAGLFLCLLAPSRGATPEAPVPGTAVEMPFLIAPLCEDDQLQGYAYISSKVVAATPSAAIEVRDKLAFIQDAFVRDVNAVPVTKPDDPKSIDLNALSARLLADARRVVGADKVADVVIIQIKVAPLRSNGQTLQAPS